MKKKYLLWGYAVIAFFIIVILCSIAFASFMSMKGARNRMADPENRKPFMTMRQKLLEIQVSTYPTFVSYSINLANIRKEAYSAIPL